MVVPTFKLGFDDQRDGLRERMLEESRHRLGQGTSTDELIRYLHDQGLHIVESMWVLAKATGWSLRDVKMTVTAHPVWQKVVEMNEPFHDELQKWAESGGLENGTP